MKCTISQMWKKRNMLICVWRNLERRMKLLVQLFPFLCKVPSVRIFRSLFKLSLLGKCIILGSFYTSLCFVLRLTDADIHYFSVCFVVLFSHVVFVFCFFVRVWYEYFAVYCGHLYTRIYEYFSFIYHRIIYNMSI